MSKILILGSLSTDFVATTDIRPDVGETVQGNNFFTTFGGKGANQAVAAARLGAEVTMLGKVGSDNFGKEIIENLNKNNISTHNVETVTDLSSGAALITIADKDNSIIYIPGANGKVDKNYVRNNKDIIKNSDMVVVQNEVPEDAVSEIIELCSDFSTPIVLNPAPFRNMDIDTINKITYLIPNESECNLLFPEKTTEEALEQYPNKLIITMGSKGVMFNNGNENKLIPSFKVDVVDTTGAGDTFVAAFSVAISSGMDTESSILFGNLVAGQSVTKYGAQGGMPRLEDIKKNTNYDKNWII